jgi:hypothetical protein
MRERVSKKKPRHDDEMRDLLRRAKFYIWSAEIPLGRPERRDETMRRFAEVAPTSRQSRPVTTTPDMAPASVEIVQAAVRSLGWRLFSLPWFLLLDSMAEIGPIAAAEAFILLDDGNTHPFIEIEDLKTAFLSVFEQHPDVFMAETKQVLKPYMSTGNRRGRGD